MTDDDPADLVSLAALLRDLPDGVEPAVVDADVALPIDLPGKPGNFLPPWFIRPEGS